MDIANKARNWCATIRTKPSPLSESIPMVQGLCDEITRLTALVESYKADAERLNWLLIKLPGDSLRYCMAELSDTADENEFRKNIDAAMKEKG